MPNRPVHRSTDREVDDATLADRVRSSLGPLVKRLDLPRVHVMCEDGVVLLHGDVADATQAGRIEAAAERVQGVTAVESHLHIGLLPSDTRPSAGRPAAAVPWLQAPAAEAGRVLARPEPEPFIEADLVGLPEPAARYLRAALTPGLGAPRAVRLTMRGQIRVGRWLPFTAVEDLDPLRGFVWSARVAGRLLVGSDRYHAGQGGMRWRLLGLLPVITAGGPDVSRSAAGRAAAECLWVPGAVLPRHGVTWEAAGPDSVLLRFSVDGTPAVVHYDLDRAGHIVGGYVDRWGDPDRTGTFGWHRCGGVVTAHRRFGAVTIPSAGRLGWHDGTDRQRRSDFFRYEITGIEPLTAP